ncbi:hypothetical protein F4805DRAFT_460211 [Annulohypoxylon moriforme]|nr:hypothetical protein F4805DRAFT_460211 [Annulohypoxylon moriforme]
MSSGLGAERVPDEQRKKEHRHNKRSTNLLKDWYLSHMAHPYPTEDEKAQLSGDTGMTVRQISYWFVNARRRNTIKPKENPNGVDNSPIADSFPIMRVSPPQAVSWDSMTPLDRWRNSPPEEEPASWDAINQSLGYDLPLYAPELDLGNVTITSSVNSSDVSNSTGSSGSSARSYSSESLLSNLSKDNRTKRRRRRITSIQRKRLGCPTKDSDRMFQCTFCTDRFRTRYDWTRHEGTVHLILEKWTCLPFGPRYCDSSEETIRCALCYEANPTDEHLTLHGCADCVAKPLSKRSFYRRDHMRQHLRTSHHVNDILPSMKQWKSKVTKVNSRCGFCGDKFTLWPERNDHLAEHFRSGAQMKDWKGCRGLDPAVALLVQNAIPPYLIGTESNDPDPFSGSRVASKEGDCGATLPTRFELLTARLGEFVSKAQVDGITTTDTDLRREARMILYGDDDPLNHTPADNPGWLGFFKQGYGLNTDSNEQVSHSATCQSPEAQHEPFSPTTLPFTLEKMQQAAITESIGVSLDLCGVFPQNQIGQDLVIPWSWQTPECLAEFSQMCQVQPKGETSSRTCMDMSMSAQPECSSLSFPGSKELHSDINCSHEQSHKELDEPLIPTSLTNEFRNEDWINMFINDNIFST